jgi:hypothetical protein
MKVAIRALLISLLIVCQTSYAVEVERLYEAEVVAESELEHDRVAAIKHALSVVLTRVLAGNDILQDDTVNAVLKNAIYYVDEYQYSLVAKDAKVKASARLMRVLFDEKLLIDVFRPSQLGFWNEIRPRTLVWLVVEQDGNQLFFDADLMPGVDAAINKASAQKKIPVLYPIQDLKEKRSLSVNDVLSAYSTHLLEVSRRYDVVSTLAGKMVKEGACWKVEWTFYFDAKIEQWRSECGSINQVALTGIQGVYDRLSKYYAVKPHIKKIASVILKVANINGMKDLTKVIGYLESLSMIKTATWVSVEDEYNVYRVFYQGRREDLNDALAKGHLLRREDFSRQKVAEVKYKLLIE